MISKQEKWNRKFVTVEPVMDFDLEEITDMILSAKPNCVFIGYNSKPNKVKLPEPSKKKTLSKPSTKNLDALTPQPTDFLKEK